MSPFSLGILGSARVVAGWTPASVSGLAGWWDASDAATFTYSSGVVVSQWADKSGNARHFAQGTVSDQPSRNGTQNSLPTIVFDGTTDYLDTSSFTLAQPLTLIYAADIADYRVAGSSGVSSVGGNLQTYWTIGLNTSRIYAGSAEVEVFTTDLPGAHVLAYSFNGASSTAWKDGTQGGTGNPGSSGTTTGLRIAERALVNRFRGSMFEIVVYSGTLSATDRQAVESYLKAKWGTP